MLRYFIFVLLLLSNTAFAGSVVKFIVPFAPGTTMDILAHVLQEDLSANLHKPVVIENKTGAGGAIAAKFVATADPSDTVLFINSSGMAVIAANTDLDYNIENLIPLATVGSAPLVLVTSPKSSIYSFRDLLKSDNVTFGNSGINSLTFLMGEVLKADLHKNIIQVPYKGINLAIPDLMSGDLNSAFLFYTSALPQIETKKLFPIVVMADGRLSELPDVPTLKELGVSGFDHLDPWASIFCNKLNPTEVETIKRALDKTLHSPKVIAALRANGVLVRQKPILPSNFLLTEQAKYQKIIKKLNISRD